MPCEGEVGYDKVKKKLESIIMDREVELKNKKKVEYNKLVRNVHVDWKNVADYLLQ